MITKEEVLTMLNDDRALDEKFKKSVKKESKGFAHACRQIGRIYTMAGQAVELVGKVMDAEAGQEAFLKMIQDMKNAGYDFTEHIIDNHFDGISAIVTKFGEFQAEEAKYYEDLEAERQASKKTPSDE